TGPPVPPLDMGDDRLAGGLEALSDEAGWALLERALNRQLLRVSDLQPEGVRRDSTTARGHGTVSEDGLCQCGHRKEHRPDLPQVQVRLSALEPVGWPVATDVRPGQRADAPLAVPAILRVRESLGRWGGLDGGHGQRGAVETRAFIPAGGGAYLGPRAAVQRPPGLVARRWGPGWPGQPRWPRVPRGAAGGQRACVAAGDERLEPVTVVAAGEARTWTERRLVVRSRQLARAGAGARRPRLAKAQAAVA